MRYQVQWHDPSTRQRGLLDQVFDDRIMAEQASSKARREDPSRTYWEVPAAESRAKMSEFYEYIPLSDAPVDEEGLLWCPEFNRHFVGRVVNGVEKRFGVASGALGVEFTHFCRYPKPPSI